MNRGFEYRSFVGSEAAGERVIDYLARRYPSSTRAEWLRRIDCARVLVDGRPARPDELLKTGQRLTWVRPPWKEPHAPGAYAILYRDAHLLAVAKPSGLPTMPGGGDFMDNTLLALVRRRFPEASPAHRLGRGTSGIVLFSLTGGAGRSLSREWSGRKVLKVYRALVSGLPDADEFRIEVPVGPVAHPILKSVFAACPEGKAAHSHAAVLERRDACSLVQVRITTGRPHQIRIHMAAAGFPLAGDPLYGAGGVPKPGSRARPSDLGYFLHNMLLGFHHPESGEWMELACAPPPVLRCRGEMRSCPAPCTK